MDKLPQAIQVNYDHPITQLDHMTVLQNVQQQSLKEDAFQAFEGNVSDDMSIISLRAALKALQHGNDIGKALVGAFGSDTVFIPGMRGVTSSTIENPTAAQSNSAVVKTTSIVLNNLSGAAIVDNMHAQPLTALGNGHASDGGNAGSARSATILTENHNDAATTLSVNTPPTDNTNPPDTGGHPGTPNDPNPPVLSGTPDGPGTTVNLPNPPGGPNPPDGPNPPVDDHCGCGDGISVDIGIDAAVSLPIISVHTDTNVDACIGLGTGNVSAHVDLDTATGVNVGTIAITQIDVGANVGIDVNAQDGVTINLNTALDGALGGLQLPIGDLAGIHMGVGGDQGLDLGLQLANLITIQTDPTGGNALQIGLDPQALGDVSQMLQPALEPVTGLVADAGNILDGLGGGDVGSLDLPAMVNDLATSATQLLDGDPVGQITETITPILGDVTNIGQDIVPNITDTVASATQLIGGDPVGQITETVMPILGDMTNVGQDIVPNITDTVSGIIPDAPTMVSGILDQAGDVMANPIPDIADQALSNVMAQGQDAVSNVLGSDNATEQVTNILSNVTDQTGDIAQSVQDMAGPNIGDAVDMGQGLLAPVMENADSAAPILSNIMDNTSSILDMGQDTTNPIMADIDTAGQSLNSGVVDTVDNAGQQMPDVLSDITGSLADVVNSAQNDTNQIIGNIDEMGQGVGTSMLDPITSIASDTFPNIVPGMEDNTQNGIDSTNTLVDNAQIIISDLTPQALAPVDVVQANAGDVFDNIDSLMASTQNITSDPIAALDPQAEDALASFGLSSTAPVLGTDVPLGALLDGTTNSVPSIADAMQSASASTGDALHDIVASAAHADNWVTQTAHDTAPAATSTSSLNTVPTVPAVTNTVSDIVSGLGGGHHTVHKGFLI